MNNPTSVLASKTADFPDSVKNLAYANFAKPDRPAGLRLYDTSNDNELLAALLKEEREFLKPHLELVTLNVGTDLYQYGSKISDVYFPTTAIVGHLYLLADGSSFEIGVTGREGMLGVSVLMADRAVSTARVQFQGFAYKLKASVLKDIAGRSAKLHDLLMRHTHSQFCQMTQNSLCSRYPVDQQFSRWILDRLDRMSGNVVSATQEMISTMLGVRRETITEAAGKLQARGLIQYRRGTITVPNRRSLELFAGGCYLDAKREFDMTRCIARN